MSEKIVELLQGGLVAHPVTRLGGPVAMYGVHVFTRMRAWRGADGLVRIFALHKHLERTYKTALVQFGEAAVPSEIIRQWHEWAIDAVKRYVRLFGDKDVYIHLGYGPFGGTEMMMRDVKVPHQTYIKVEGKGRLYGERIIAVSEFEHPLHDTIGLRHKTGGKYDDITKLRNRAKAQFPNLDSARRDLSVEAVLFSSVPRGRSKERNRHVAELGCAAVVDKAFRFSSKPHFPSITEQAVKMMVRERFGMQPRHGLRRNDLFGGAAALGTAGGVTLFEQFDHESVIVPQRLLDLEYEYGQLVRGALPQSREWTTLVPGV